MSDAAGPRPLDAADATLPSPVGLSPFLNAPRSRGDLGVLGPYRLEAELGRGGMGIVYRAYDETLQRPVALKILRPELADEAARARLVREAQVAAGFRHDHVVTVHAVVNPPDGPPYLVMEYLAGPTLAQLIRGRQRLTPQEAAAVVVQVADGLAAAHAAGLVHRDVKPSNVLFDPATGRVKVTDFGLARNVAQSSTLTREGALVGTPAYMSPEQARGSNCLDARTDVYSLGVTLYEALTGDAPFRGAPPMVFQQVLNDDPRPPRRLNDAIPRDLETITLKAMAREPSRRYGSAAELADDLRRWQRGEPVRARPAGAIERGWRWCRRNPRVAALSGAIVCLLALLAAGSTLAAVWIAHAKAQADRERVAAEEARGRADDNARAATRHFTLALDALSTLIGGVQDDLDSRPGTLPLRERLATEALAGLEKIARGAEETPTASEGMAQAHARLGDLFYQLGRTDEARRQYDRSQAVAEELLAADPHSVAARQALACALVKRGNVVRYSGAWRTAAADYRRALALREALADEAPDDEERRRDLALTWGKVGDISLDSGDPAAARDAYERQLRLLLQSRSAAASPRPVALLRDLSCTCGQLGDACLGLLDYAAAGDWYRQALQYAEARLAADPENPVARHHLAGCWQDLGYLGLRAADFDAAEKAYGQAVGIGEELVAADPDKAHLRHDLARCYDGLADVRRYRGELEASRKACRRGLDLCEPLARANPGSLLWLRDVTRLYRGLALIEEREEHFAEAARSAERALAACRCTRPEGAADTQALQELQQEFATLQQADDAAVAHGLEDLAFILSQPPPVAARLLQFRALSQARHGRYRAAAATAEHLQQLPLADAEKQLTAARVYALCAAGSAETRQAYADRAVEAVRAAVRLNPRMAGLLRSTVDLDPIRAQPGYQALLEDLGRGQRREAANPPERRPRAARPE